MKHTLNDYVTLLSKNSLIEKLNLAEPSAAVENVTYNSKEAGKNTLFICKGAHFKEEYLSEALSHGSVLLPFGNRICRRRECISGKRYSPALWRVVFDYFYRQCVEKYRPYRHYRHQGKVHHDLFIKYILDEYLKSEKKPSCAYISSIDTYDGTEKFESHLTTPEAGELYKHFSNAVNAKIPYLVMEVSSQALKYDRVYGVGFDIGVYLNIGEDHISAVEHPDFDDYFASKMKLFSHCKRACVSLDTLRRDEVLQAASVCEKVITFSTTDEKADVYAYNIRKSGNDTVFHVRTPEYSEEFTLTIPGLFNVQNALAAISVCLLLGIPKHFVYVGLMKARSSGRMESYTNSDNKIVTIVDYAHNKLSFECLYDSVTKEFPADALSRCSAVRAARRFSEERILASLPENIPTMSTSLRKIPAKSRLCRYASRLPSMWLPKAAPMRSNRTEARPSARRFCRPDVKRLFL